MDLLIRVSDLATLRRLAAEKKTALAEHQAAFDAEHAVEIQTAKLAAEAVANAETALRAVAAEEYAKTNNAKLCPGIVVKEFSVLHYDNDAAFAWAKETKMALTPEALDAKAFEKIAKAAPGIAGSYVVVEPRITIATDLDKALSSVEGAAEVSV